MKRVVCLILTVGMLLALAGCGGAGDGETMTCTLQVRCDVLLEHMEELTAGKAALVPADGVILPETVAEFKPGDTVFDVFRKVLREEKIHFEYVDATLYDTAYVEGIANLYEFDCGPQSGWMYSVNGEFVSLGCSAYTLSEGDAIVFSYTCDLGADLGAEYQNEE